jgi:CheY-like chemotaxis protein
MIRRILLADDDGDDKVLFEEVFSSLPADQYQLICMTNGEEVLTYLRDIVNPAHLPDLIILDQNMPVMSGKETLDVLKSDERYKDIPVVVYSTYNEKSFIEECHAQGVVAVVSKPDSYEGYIQMINTLLKYSRKPVV